MRTGSGLEALQQQPGVDRRERRAEGAHDLHARLHGVAEVAEGLVEDHAVVAGRGRRSYSGTCRCPSGTCPTRRSRRPSWCRGRRCTWSPSARRCRRPTRAAGRGRARARCCRPRAGCSASCAIFASASMSTTLIERIAERLGVEQLGVRLDRSAEVLRVVGIDERRLDAELLQVHAEQRVRAAVERRGGDDVVAGLQQRQDRDRLGRLAGGAWRAPRGRPRAPPCAPRAPRPSGSRCANRRCRRSAG